MYINSAGADAFAPHLKKRIETLGALVVGIIAFGFRISNRELKHTGDSIDLTSTYTRHLK